MKFTLIAQDKQARSGLINLPHGQISTPVFMPVGTYGAVKTISPEELKSINTEIILGNTFHLWLRPGMDVIAKHKGLHKFMRTRIMVKI